MPYLCSTTFNSRSIAGVSRIKRATVSHIKRSLTPYACDNFPYGLNGTPSARRAVRHRSGQCSRREHHWGLR
jgi:hypothetical protein